MVGCRIGQHGWVPAVWRDGVSVNHFHRIADDIDVAPLLDQIGRAPDLWGVNQARIKPAHSPHRAVSDIWVRFRTEEDLARPEAYLEPHFARWWPAAERLPAVKNLCYDLMWKVGAVYLGGVLITKLPAGEDILPHHDRGAWHSEWLNCKVYVPLQSDPGCINACEDEAIEMEPGTAWSFDNLRVHSVSNRSARDRINVIVCMRVE